MANRSDSKLSKKVEQLERKLSATIDILVKENGLVNSRKKLVKLIKDE